MAYLAKKISKRETLYKSTLFPKLFKKSCKKNIVLVGIGGNIGDSKRRFEKLIFFLQKEKRIKLIVTSIIYKNPPFGYLEQNDFYNTLFIISTSLSPKKLMQYLLSVEKKFKRKRLFKDGPRTLDLDIILYNKLKVQYKKFLIVPHPKWQERKSVLLPLQYLKGSSCLKKVL